MTQQTAIVLHPVVKYQQTSDLRSFESKLNEAKSLAMAIDLSVNFAQIISLNNVTPKTFFGAGKVEDIATLIKAEEINLAIINCSLTPVQQRNLENAFKCKVIDRTALILEIFGKRAQTKEGRLQVDLAAQEYQKSRLVRSWTHLERQRGGGGFLGGPGEKQIESDRRIINDRITKIKSQLKKVVRTREIHRKSRKKIPYDIVSLVGYTNAGKSTLFNKLTGATVMAEDKLFATLDPTMRLIKLPSGKKIILSDTVGFISDLPTELVAAFRATLEEVVEANIILHIRDIANKDSAEQKKDVIAVLENLGLEAQMQQNMIEVLNKTDLLEKSELDKLNAQKNTICISAVTGDKIEKLLNIIDKKLSIDNKTLSIDIACDNGKIIAWLHANSTILSQNEIDDKIKFKISISKANLGKLNKMLS